MYKCKLNITRGINFLWHTRQKLNIIQCNVSYSKNYARVYGEIKTKNNLRFAFITFNSSVRILYKPLPAEIHNITERNYRIIKTLNTAISIYTLR